VVAICQACPDKWRPPEPGRGLQDGALERAGGAEHVQRRGVLAAAGDEAAAVRRVGRDLTAGEVEAGTGRGRVLDRDPLGVRGAGLQEPAGTAVQRAGRADEGGVGFGARDQHPGDVAPGLAFAVGDVLQALPGQGQRADGGQRLRLAEPDLDAVAGVAGDGFRRRHRAEPVLVDLESAERVFLDLAGADRLLLQQPAGELLQLAAANRLRRQLAAVYLGGRVGAAAEGDEQGHRRDYQCGRWASELGRSHRESPPSGSFIACLPQPGSSRPSCVALRNS
jgi:hypothetical protein